MDYIYQISIHSYSLFVYISSFFNPKAKLWINGRKKSFETLQSNIKKGDKVYWFHCASLGEFEQGKPLIDELKLTTKDCKILVTFFSPSGYELRKNYENADCVVYLPIDNQKNARKFLDIAQPKEAFFIKYEFWLNYLFELDQRNIPTYLISGVFRKNQLFFKWYGSTHKKMLTYFSHFFVQNESSKNLLTDLGFQNISVSGDTRLDRVYENSLTPRPVNLIKKFKGSKKIIILGSSWQKEEKIIAEYIQSCNKDFKFIIAPHNVNQSHIKKIKNLLKNNYICYSEAKSTTISSVKTLIIDNIGILANIYQYTDIAFIGGGFSGALHNILEPASFGNAVLFGPKHDKFHEAENLMKIGAAFQINDTDDLIAIINRLLLETNLEESQTAAQNYISNGRGACQMILKKLELTSH